MVRKLRRSLLRALVATALVVAGASAHSADDITDSQFRVSRAALFTTSPEDGVEGTQVLCDYFAEEYRATAGTGAPVHAEVAPSFDAIESGLREGTIHFAYVTAMEYLRLQERVEAELVALTTPVESDRLSRAVVVVRAENAAKSIADLKGRTFARSGRTSTVGYLYPQWLLVSAGLPRMEAFFGKVLDVRSDKSAFFAVANGDADCAAVDETLLATVQELSPGVAKRCRVLATSEPMPLGVVVASAKNARDGLTNVIHLVAQGVGAGASKVREAMRLIRIGGLTSARAGDLDYVKRLWRDVSAAEARFVDPICGRECAPAAVGVPGPRLEVAVGAEIAHFCSEACLEEFRRHDELARIEGRGRLLVMGILQPLGVDSKWPDVVAASQALFDEVAAKTGYRFALEAYTSRAMSEARIRSGVLALVSVSATDYPGFHADFRAVAVARARVTEDPERLLLVTKAPNDRNGVAGLRGKRIAYAKSSDLPTASYLKYLTRGLGVPEPEDAFSEILVCPSDVSAIRAVSADQVDAALVASSSLEALKQMSPGVTRKLVCAEASWNFVNGPVCVLPGLDAEAASCVVRTLIEMNDYPAGKQLLRMFGAIEMVVATDAEYDTVRALLGEVKGK